MPITTNVVSSNPVHGEVYPIQHYVIKFVSDLRQVFSINKTDRHEITEILLKVTLSSVTLISSFLTNPPATTKLRNN